MWKFKDFSTNQILREINFGDSRSAKLLFCPFGVCEFCPFGKNKDLKGAKIEEMKIQSL